MNIAPATRAPIDTTKPLAIAVMAMGGQGGGVLVAGGFPCDDQSRHG